MRVRAVVAGIVVPLAVGVMLPSSVAMAQWGRGRMMGGGYGAMEGRYGGGYGAMEGRYGAPAGGYGYQEGQAPYGGGYPPAGYGAPPGGYAPSAYGGGYPPQGYPPPAYQQPYAYPPPGQNPQQASANQMQCQTWATSQSGYNPNAPTTGTASTSATESAMAGGRSVVRGGARAAAVGRRGGRHRR
jgi:hypothetical protein